MYEVFEHGSSVPMSMLKALTIKLGILGHTAENDKSKSPKD